MKRVLLLATTTGYQTRMFAEAARKLGVELIYATDRCDQLEDPWRDGAIPVRFHEEARSLETIVAALKDRPIAGVLAIGDRPTVLAALVSDALGLPGNPPDAARAARDKALSREKFRAAGMQVPECFTVPLTTDPASLLRRITWPVVVKPLVLSGSRGVIRANDPDAFIAAFQRLRRLLESEDVRELRDERAQLIQIEEYIPGTEYAVEGWAGENLRVFAVFDKPDPLDGPFFEETIYVTPSRNRHREDAILQQVAQGIRALGLTFGPIHAEVRVNDRGVYVLEIAARPIGGLCSKVLRFTNGHRDVACGLEEMLLRKVLDDRSMDWSPDRVPSAVMMIPIPKGGIFRRVIGVERARSVAGVEDVIITAKTDQRLVPLPEGASYLGFIVARGESPEDAERAVRWAHEQLRFEIDPVIEVIRETASL